MARGEVGGQRHSMDRVFRATSGTLQTADEVQRRMEPPQLALSTVKRYLKQLASLDMLVRIEQHGNTFYRQS